MEAPSVKPAAPVDGPSGAAYGAGLDRALEGGGASDNGLGPLPISRMPSRKASGKEARKETWKEKVQFEEQLEDQLDEQSSRTLSAISRSGHG